jgi:hypothetical protein
MHKLKQIWKNIKVKFSYFKSKIKNYILAGY